MKITFRLASAFVILLPLGILPFATAFPSTQNSQQAPEKDSDATPSVSQIQSSLQREPDNAKLYIKLGRAYWNNGDFQPAFDAFQQAVKLTPNSAEAHNWLGAFLMGRGNLPEAISELRKTVSLDPKYARGYTNLGPLWRRAVTSPAP